MGTLASPLVERRDGGCEDAGRGRLRRPSWCLDTWVIYGSTKYNGGKHLAPSFVVLRYMGGDACAVLRGAQVQGWDACITLRET